jgi:tight adherence protein C
MTPTLMLVIGLVGIFASIALTLSVIGVATSEKRAVGRSLAAIRAINSAPEELRGEIDRPFSERVLVPTLERFVGIGKRVTGQDTTARIRQKLDQAGNPKGWTVERVLGAKFVGFVVLLVVSILVTMIVGLSLPVTVVVCVGLTMLGFAVPNLLLHQKAYDREQSMRKDLPDALDLLTISVEAGLGFDAALTRVAQQTEGQLADEFARVLQEMQIGMGRAQAIRAMGDRTKLADLRGFATAMVQADAFGIPIGQVLRVQSGEMRIKRRQRAEELAQKVPVKILFPLIFCILPTLFATILGPAGITIMENMGGMG